MSQPIPPLSTLAYESAVPGRISTTRQAAWISLTIVGVLTILAGLCQGGLSLFVADFLSRSPSVAAPVPSSYWLIATAALSVGLGHAVGIAEITCSLKLRRRSVGAGVVGAVLIGLQLLVAAWLAVMIFRELVSTDPITVILCIFCGAAACGLAGTEFLLIKVLREQTPHRC